MNQNQSSASNSFRLAYTHVPAIPRMTSPKAEEEGTPPPGAGVPGLGSGTCGCRCSSVESIVHKRFFFVSLWFSDSF